MVLDDDVMSQVSWAAASESDRMLFSVLSNTDRLDMERLPRISPQPQSPRIEELPTVYEETAPATTENVDDFVRRMEEDVSRQRHVESPRIPTPPPPPRPPTPPPPQRPPTPPPPAPMNYDTLDRAIQEPTHTETVPAQPTEDQATSQITMDKEREQMFEKQSTLYDLNQLESRGVRLTRRWTMDDSLDEMTHELRHHLLVLDERENVGMMKNGLKMALTGIEIVNTRFNLLDLEGWSAQAATDLDKQDGNLSRIYRKYWRRSTSNNPESEIMFSLFSSMGMYHMKRSMARQMMNRNARAAPRGRRRAPASPDDSSDDERPPGNVR